MGIASAVLMLVVHGEPRHGDEPVVVLAVLFWPAFFAYNLPIYLARRIRAARDRKPAPLPDEAEEWR